MTGRRLPTHGGPDTGRSLNRVRTGELPWTKLDVLHRMVLDELLVRFKIAGLTEEEKVTVHEGDLRAARALGLRTAYVHRPLEFGPTRASNPPQSGSFDFVAGDFQDLATQLGA